MGNLVARKMIDVLPHVLPAGPTIDGRGPRHAQRRIVIVVDQ
jgi:hypothetical protein